MEGFVVAPLGKEKEYFGELTPEGAALLAVKDCPIKAQYRVADWAVPAKHHVEPTAEEEGGGADEEEEQPKDRGKKKWGKGKQRREAPKKKKNPWLGGRPGMVPRIGPMLCQAFAEGACKFGDGCKFPHDVDKFIAQKPPNIGDRCHVFDTYGYCSDGIKCRFSGGHTAADGKTNIVDAERYAQHKAHRETKFPADEEVLHQLTKNKYPLTRAKEVVAQYEANFKQREDQRPKVDKAAAAAGVNADATVAEPEVKRTKQEEALWAAVQPELRPPLDLAGKLYLAPLTTIGNLPFRRVCVGLGCDVTCGEMAVAENILKGKRSEWVLMKRHPSEKIFGVQLAANRVFDACAAAQLVEDQGNVDFVDLNCGCPIDIITGMGMGSALLERVTRLRDLCYGFSNTLKHTPFTIKVRTGKKTATPTIHKILPELKSWGCAAITMHGRSWDQRYTKEANWDYIRSFAANSPIPVIGNGDAWDYTTWKHHMENDRVGTVMFARGAIIKPWVFSEIKERKMWDISSSERLGILRNFTNYGLEHWGSDWEGVEKTRNFLLQTLSFMHRYVPYGVMECYPVEMWHRPVPFVGRDDLETLMASPFSESWIELSEMLLGPVPQGFRFEPKHASNSYSQSVLASGGGAAAAPAPQVDDQDEW